MTETEFIEILDGLFWDGWYDALASEYEIDPEINQKNRDLKIALLKAEFNKMHHKIKVLQDDMEMLGEQAFEANFMLDCVMDTVDIEEVLKDHVEFNKWEEERLNERSKKNS